jgi:hypothetical protein
MRKGASSSVDSELYVKLVNRILSSPSLHLFVEPPPAFS